MLDTIKTTIAALPLEKRCAYLRGQIATATATLAAARELLPITEQEEVDVVRDQLRRLATDVGRRIMVRRAREIAPLWLKRKPEMSALEAKSSVRVVLALATPAPELSEWAAGRASLVQRHGPGVVDAAAVEFADPDIREQVEAQCQVAL